MNLIELLKSPEGKTIEFKRELPARLGIVHTVIAFANTSGGTVIIGVEDGTRRIVGVLDPLTIEEKITSLITDLIAPQILPEIEILSYKKLQIIKYLHYMQDLPGGPRNFLSSFETSFGYDVSFCLESG